MAAELGISVLCVIFLSVQFCSGGVLEVDACTMCDRDEQMIRCAMATAAAVSVVGCPGANLWTDRDFIVTALRGWAAEVQLTRTTLECGEIKTRPATLNGKKCADDSETVKTSSTTTTERYPWWPVHYPVNERDGLGSNYSTTTATTTTTSTNGTTAMTIGTTTVMFAVTTGLRFNSWLVFGTLAVSVTAIGTFVTIRCWRRRLRRQPIQIQEVSSTATEEDLPTRRRRTSRTSSWESVELFVMNKED